MLESARTRENRRRDHEANEPSFEEGLAVRSVRRSANEQKAVSPVNDAQGLVEFECECVSAACERSVRVPLYVFRRLLEAGDQYLLQTGHHASPRYRTIVAFGLGTIEEDV